MTTMISRPSSPNQGAATATAHSRLARWRDPRLAVGVALVALCGLGGARLMADADDTTPVWVAARDLAAGATLSDDDLRLTHVHFASEREAAGYLRGPIAVAEAQAVVKPVAEGELVPVSAVSSGHVLPLTAMALSVSGQGVPASLKVGDLIDVWVAPAEVAEVGVATLVLSDARVLSLPSGDGSFDPMANTQVVVGVDAGSQRPLSEVLGLLAGGTVALTTEVTP